MRRPSATLPGGQAIVTVVEMTNKPKGLHLNCEQCEIRCDHIAGVLGLVLDEKLTLGLSAPPDPRFWRFYHRVTYCYNSNK